jgi:YfiH family protein
MIYQFSSLLRFDDLAQVVTSAHRGECDNFNIADHVGSNCENAINNRRLICNQVGLNCDRLTTGQQVHKTNVAVVTSQDVGKGSDSWKSAIPETDALVTNLRDTPIMVISADCLLILLYDPVRKAIGVIHASWRTTFGGIIGKTVELMRKTYQTSPNDLIVGIGPGAGACCYEVDDPFVKTISERPELLPFVVQRNDKRYFDLPHAGQSELISAGVSMDHIEMMNRCTICDTNFFSYRRQGKAAGRFGLIASLR